MTTRELLTWQWDGYARYHQHRGNLMLHLFTVPLFMLANLALVVSLVSWSWTWLVVGGVGVMATLFVEGWGHKRESVPPEPFTGPVNFVARFFFEHWITFPRFVLSGGWARNLCRR